jgi:DNA repair exonuclease SbcCD ATPase subunit
VVKTKLELDGLRAFLAERRKEAEQVKPGDGSPMTFAQQNAEAEARRAALRRVSEQVEIERLDADMARVEARLAETPAVAEKLNALEREYKHLLESYQDFSDKQQSASVQADLERRQLGEQFRVLEQAFEAAEGPVAPNRILIVALGVVLGLALGAGIGMLLEAIDPSVHDWRQLQAEMRIPVLASIPQIWLEADRARLRRKRIRTAFGTAAVVVFALFGGAANYVWVNGLPLSPGQAAAPGVAAAPAAEAAGAAAAQP